MNPDPFLSGYRLIDGDELNDVVANPEWSVSGDITATVGGTVLTSAKIVATVTNLTTVAATGAGVSIPQAMPGRVLVIVNQGANSAQVFAEKGSTIDGVAGNVGIPVLSDSAIVIVGVAVDEWISIVSSPYGAALPLSNGESQASLLHFYGTNGTGPTAESWLSLVQADIAANHNDTLDPIAIAYSGAYWFQGGTAWNYTETVLAAYYGWDAATAAARILTAQQYAYANR